MHLTSCSMAISIHHEAGPQNSQSVPLNPVQPKFFHPTTWYLFGHHICYACWYCHNHVSLLSLVFSSFGLKKVYFSLCKLGCTASFVMHTLENSEKKSFTRWKMEERIVIYRYRYIIDECLKQHFENAIRIHSVVLKEKNDVPSPKFPALQFKCHRIGIFFCTFDEYALQDKVSRKGTYLSIPLP